MARSHSTRFWPSVYAPPVASFCMPLFNGVGLFPNHLGDATKQQRWRQAHSAAQGPRYDGKNALGSGEAFSAIVAKLSWDYCFQVCDLLPKRHT